MSARRRPRLYLLASPETSPLVLYGLLDVLGTVGELYSELTAGRPGEPVFDVRLTAATGAPFRCHGRVVVAYRGRQRQGAGVREGDALWQHLPRLPVERTARRARLAVRIPRAESLSSAWRS
jgi:hypothetical protein